MTYAHQQWNNNICGHRDFKSDFRSSIALARDSCVVCCDGLACSTSSCNSCDSCTQVGLCLRRFVQIETSIIKTCVFSRLPIYFVFACAFGLEIIFSGWGASLCCYAVITFRWKQKFQFVTKYAFSKRIEGWRLHLKYQKAIVYF